ncbi:MAG TPA: hypothetical protein VL307_20870 [Chitinophagaceae bacterium]|nr:hypothetical protein [Chitinophagaceae bacterium]
MFLFYCHTITPRLRYIVDFISKELFEEPITCTSSLEEYSAFTGPRFNYSDKDFSEQEFYLKPVALLFEKDIRPQAIECFEVDYQKAFFQTSGDFAFDVLAASFYLLSRYEEYLPHEKDMYGRFAHTHSLAYKEHFLHLPLVNIWLEDLKKKLKKKFPALVFRRRPFKFIPSYDIDIAWSYRHKGWLRNMAGYLRSVKEGKWWQVRERWNVLNNKAADPFDAYEWLDALHLYCKIKPIYFFLVAQKYQGYDRNTPTSSKALQELIAYFSVVYKVGLHPSWQSSVSDNSKTLLEEKEWLEVIIDRPLEHSRQHYIKFTLPQSCRRYIEAGLLKDYSMGYGSINGFRASVASSFHWFDLENNETTALQFFPFCFMDANAFYEQKLTPQQAYEELMHYYNTIKKLNGLFVIIWHNQFLGTDKTFAGWRETYELFMKESIYWDAYNF